MQKKESELAASVGRSLPKSVLKNTLATMKAHPPNAKQGEEQGAQEVADEDVDEVILNSELALGVMPSKATPVQLRELVTMWERGIEKATAALQSRQVALQTLPLGHMDWLALLEDKHGSVTFVHGLAPDCLLGRYVKLDEHNGVKAIVNVGDRQHPTSYADSIIIHPAVGTPLREVKDETNKKRRTEGQPISQRPRILPEITTLVEMWKCAKGCGLPEESCCFCGEDADEDKQVKYCWLCSLSLHGSCARTAEQSWKAAKVRKQQKDTILAEIQQAEAAEAGTTPFQTSTP